MSWYFLRSAYEMIEKDDSSEGTEYIVPSLIASQIYAGQTPRQVARTVQRLPTWRPAVFIMAGLSRFLNSSSVFVFFIMPSARIVPRAPLKRVSEHR